MPSTQGEPEIDDAQLTQLSSLDKQTNDLWSQVAKELDWHTPWQKVIDWHYPYARWFV